MKINKEKVHKCEYCGRYTDRPYHLTIAVPGEHGKRTFCMEKHADAWLVEKYQLPLPFENTIVPESNNGTNNEVGYA